MLRVCLSRGTAYCPLPAPVCPAGLAGAHSLTSLQTAVTERSPGDSAGEHLHSRQRTVYFLKFPSSLFSIFQLGHPDLLDRCVHFGYKPCQVNVSSENLLPLRVRLFAPLLVLLASKCTRGGQQLPLPREAPSPTRHRARCRCPRGVRLRPCVIMSGRLSGL